MRTGLWRIAIKKGISCVIMLFTTVYLDLRGTYHEKDRHAHINE